MAEHTPGFVKVSDKHGLCLVAFASDEMVADLSPGGGAAWTGTRADAERLAAAWNACDGISTESLEGGVVANLLAACEAVVHECNAVFVDTDEMSPEWRQIEKDCRAAIAAAKGTN